MSTDSLHDAYAADYDSQVRAYGCYLAEVLLGLSFEFIRPGERILDVGTGSGLAAELFARAGLQVEGMDFSGAMLEICRAKGVTTNLTQHDIQQVPWPYPTERFDHLACCGVFHFVWELESIFGETDRVLRRGGVFAFTTRAPKEAGLGKYEQQESGGFDVFSHSPAYVESLLAQVKFEAVKRLRCFVGEDIFYAWVVRKRGEGEA